MNRESVHCLMSWAWIKVASNTRSNRTLNMKGFKNVGTSVISKNKVKIGFDVELVFLPRSMTKFLQLLDVYFFQQCKYLITRIVEYLRTHRSVCRDIDMTTRESTIKLHKLAINQFFTPTFDYMRRYAFQKASIRDTDLIFRSIKQSCFNLTNNTCNNGETFVIESIWYWKLAI